MTNTRVRVFIIAVSFILVFVGFFVIDAPRRIRLGCMEQGLLRDTAIDKCAGSTTVYPILGWVIVGLAAIAALFAMFVMQSPPKNQPTPLIQ